MSKPFYDWYESHFGWSMLILSFMAIFPHLGHVPLFAGQHTALTARRVFYPGPFSDMQVAIFLLMLPCWFFLKQMTVLTVLFILVIAYYIIGYKQLFGYGAPCGAWLSSLFLFTVARYCWGISCSFQGLPATFK